MEIRTIDSSKETLEIEVLGENETLLNPLKVKLLGDEDVELAEYIIEHPFLSTPKIYIRTKKGEPLAALKRALKALHKEYKDLDSALDAAVPEDLKKNAA